VNAHAAFAGIDRDSLRRAGRMVASIEGMWCASCALAAERVIARTPGVTWASISFAGGSALIRWDPDRFDLDGLLSRVERLGYRIVPLIEADQMEQRIDAQARAVWLRLAVAVFFGMWSMLGSIALYADAGLAQAPEGWWIALGATVAALPAVTYSAWAFYRAGWRTLRAGVPGMDALVSLGVLASCLLSFWRLAQGSAEVYVDTATMLVGFLLCGRLIELYARRRNSDAVNALRQAVPETARRLAADGSFAEIPAAEVRAGEHVLVYAGERIAVDGIVIEGESDIDRALVTGESAPVPIRPGGAVEAGCVNLSCAIRVRVEQPCGQRFIDRIGVRMLELFGAKSAVALQAERFARWLIPFALALSGATFLYAYQVSGDATHAVLRALSVLVAACPCAVGLALPLAYAASTASAARRGILFRDPASMEALARAKEVLFDKTGTLTSGKLEVVDVIAPGHARQAVLHWAGLAETGIAHPVAQAIRDAAKESVPGPVPVLQGKAQRHGQGSAWKSEDGRHAVLVGAAAWLAGQGIAVPAPAVQSGTRVEVALDGEWIGALVLQDRLRAEARDAVTALQAGGLNTRLVTGDAAGAALRAAEEAGLPARLVHAGCRPEQKVEIVDAAQKPVVFLGDGVNDSLALAAADCGVAVCGASTAAVATAGVVIASGGLDSVVAAWRHARRTLRIVRQNLMFSMVYNLAVLSLAATGVVPPVAAAAAMLASSLSVVANAARLAKA
jgi:heavy metal translocating P-type ATPase